MLAFQWFGYVLVSELEVFVSQGELTKTGDPAVKGVVNNDDGTTDASEMLLGWDSVDRSDSTAQEVTSSLTPGSLDAKSSVEIPIAEAASPLDFYQLLDRSHEPVIAQAEETEESGGLTFHDICGDMKSFAKTGLTLAAPFLSQGHLNTEKIGVKQDDDDAGTRDNGVTISDLKARQDRIETAQTISAFLDLARRAQTVDFGDCSELYKKNDA